MVDDNPAEEDDDFELDLEAVDVVSFGSPLVSMGFVELELESIRWQCPGGFIFDVRACVAQGALAGSHEAYENKELK